MEKETILRIELRNKKITGKDLAIKLGFSEVQVSAWVRGEKSPTVKNKEKICKFFECSPVYLFPIDDKLVDAMTDTEKISHIKHILK